MSAAPFDVKLVMARLKEHVPALLEVGTAGDFMVAQKAGSYRTPSAFVILGRELGVPRSSGVAPPGAQVATSQLAAAQFAVVVAVRNYRDQAGVAASDDLVPMLTATRKAVLYWTPNLPGARPCQFVRGDVHDYDAATLVWADVFQTQHSISNR